MEVFPILQGFRLLVQFLLNGTLGSLVTLAKGNLKSFAGRRGISLLPLICRFLQAVQPCLDPSLAPFM